MSWGITSEAKTELRDEARRRRVAAKKHEIRLRRSDRDALTTNIRRRIFGL